MTRKRHCSDADASGCCKVRRLQAVSTAVLPAVRPIPARPGLSGRTGRSEVVRVVWTPALIRDLLKLFWECHDPTQETVRQ